ncbi:hypothetical protein TNCV_2757771 [Trichonephila clavipes]|nr:hypothetical protein TNCV_2757771 [Trichonephila clavipes]
MLPVLGKKAVLEWCMQGLIGSSYVCPKCGKSMELRERTVYDIKACQSLIYMVYEACLRTEARPSVKLAEKLSVPERIPTPPAQRPAEPERPPLEMMDPSVSVNTVEV